MLLASIRFDSCPQPACTIMNQENHDLSNMAWFGKAAVARLTSVREEVRGLLREKTNDHVWKGATCLRTASGTNCLDVLLMRGYAFDNFVLKAEFWV